MSEFKEVLRHIIIMQRIKKAIGVSIQSSDDTKLNEELAYGFLLLSAWQESVGNQTLGLISPTSTWMKIHC